MPEKTKNILADIQTSSPENPIKINCVGIKGIQCHVRLRDKNNGSQVTVATASLGVDLSPVYKGTHMSRLVEALQQWNEELNYHSMRALLTNMRERLNSGRAWAAFRFPYLMFKTPPATENIGSDIKNNADNSAPNADYGSHKGATIGYNCVVTGELEGNELKYSLEIEVPVMTVCPCSKAISKEGAHSQRALVRLKIGIASFVWLEEFIELAENSGSSPVYPLLKRKDEKYITELAFSRPKFVEDVARDVADALNKHPLVSWFEVEVESMESIHNHNAFACVYSR